MTNQEQFNWEKIEKHYSSEGGAISLDFIKETCVPRENYDLIDSIRKISVEKVIKLSKKIGELESKLQKVKEFAEKKNNEWTLGVDDTHPGNNYVLGYNQAKEELKKII
jgi:hypothetical protein